VGDRVVCLPLWVRPVLVSPVGAPRLCRLVTMPDGAEVVVVSEGGEVVAFVPVVDA
jgi:CelD/BcsL family acetyltransferase involved in cellulose biosynthesis